MPIETAVVAAAPTARPLSDIRLRRILRFTIAVTLATAYACYVNWTFSFLLIALVVAMMALPTPAPSLGFAVRTVIMLLLLQGLGLLLMLPLLNHQVAGLALVLLLLFLYFQFQAQGKSAPSNATFVVVCFTLTAAFGAISLDAGVAWAKGLSKSVLALFPIIWIAFALLPQGTFAAAPKPPPVEGGPVRQAIVALRPVVVLIPLMIFMLGSENSIRYLTGYYQAAVISQHPARATSRALAIDLVLATVYGCTAGLAMWWLIKLWPSLLWVVLLMAIFSFIFASRIFPPGPQPLSPHFVRWYYSMITLVLIVFPEAMSQGFTGDDADMKVVERVLDYLFITAYTAFAVLLYDAIVDRLSALHRRFARGAK